MARRGSTTYTLTCVVCGATFTRKNQARQPTCSPACGYTYRTQKKAGTAPLERDAGRDLQVERLKRDLASYRGAYEGTLREREREARILELFGAAVARLPGPTGAALRPARPRAATGAGAVPEVPVLLLGDLHVGEVIDPRQTHGINGYDWPTFCARLEHLERRVVDILTHHQRGRFPELVILSLGDCVSGRIHVELEKHGAQHLVDQVYLGALAVALFAWRLHQALQIPVRLVGLSGNHGRLDPSKESKFYYKNFDFLFHSIVATALADTPAITVKIPPAIFTIETVAEQRILASHGMELPPSSLGIPLYSINRASAQYQAILAAAKQPRFDYWVLGHVHRPMELDSAVVNGCMSGLSEYSLGKVFTPIIPVQKLIAFHPAHGLAWQYPIRLDQAPPATIYTWAADESPAPALAAFAQRRQEARRG